MGSLSPLITGGGGVEDLFFKDLTDFQNAVPLPLHLEKEDRFFLFL